MPHTPTHLEDPPAPEPTATAEPVPDPTARPRREPKPAPPTKRPRRPSARRDVGTAWLVLLGLLVMAIVPLAIELGRPAQFTHDEARAAGTAIETWHRKAGFTADHEPLDPWVPVDLGRLRYDQPPGATWLHVVTLGVGERLAVTGNALTQLRWASVVMALLLVASVFWAGHNIGGLLTAVLSGCIAMTLPLVLFFGRLAAPEMAIAAWSALAMAAALWAMRPLRRNPSLLRQMLGWLICGTALGMALLTGGPMAVPVAAVPILVVALICPHRIGHTLGLTAAVAVAALLVTPWAIYVHESTPDGWRHWLAAMTPPATAGSISDYALSVVWRVLAMAALAGVWIVWLLPTVLQPFTPADRAIRLRLLLGWAWLVSTAALLAFAPGPALLGALLPAAAPAALAIGQAMRRYHDLCAEGRHPRLWTQGRWVAVGLTGLLSLALPAYGWLERDLPGWATALLPPHDTLFAVMHPGYWAGLCAVLCMITAIAGKFAVAHHPGRAVAGWAAWTLAATTVCAIPLARGPAFNAPANAALAADTPDTSTP